MPYMEGNEELKIFFPCSLLNSRSGLCIGVRDESTRLVCILGILHHVGGHQDALSNLIREASECSDLRIYIIGKFINKSLGTGPDVVADCGGFLELEQRHHNGIPVCRVTRTPWQQTVVATGHKECTPLLVLFDDKEIQRASLSLTPQMIDGNDRHSPESEAPILRASSSSDTDSGNKTARQRTSHLFAEFYCLRSAIIQFSTVPSTAMLRETLSMTSVSSAAVDGHGGLLYRACKQLVALMVSALGLIFRLPKNVSSSRWYNESVVKTVLTYPATVGQLANKSQQVCELVRDGVKPDTKEKADVSDTSTKLDYIRTGNVLLSIFVDLLLGISLFYWMHATEFPVVFAKIIISWADQTGIALQQLLHWLMGAPAGLKLNTSLAHFLGNFFLYHVYLWLGYLGIMWPLLPSLLWCIAGSGALGLSVLLAQTSDLISVLTFHIYCFYVYAARLYRLQISALLSLARLFQGKKWNVLRQRVDSCSYDVDQLFIGTLLFTMLLFMLPTTALFYIVFTLLRVVVLVVQSFVTLLRDVLSTFPWFSLLLWVCGSDSLNDGVQFRVLRPSPGQPTSLLLQMQLMPLSSALMLGRSPAQVDGEKQSLLLIGKKLVSGQLIYPWGRDGS
ncbi:uncharacterized protein [Diadema setosum]|uniref:uncharacterized protein n=1 Tax=Diadema setosum TaxID=31175 RepID=UPI003B3B9298